MINHGSGFLLRILMGLLAVMFLVGIESGEGQPEQTILFSPDSSIKLHINTSNGISYSVYHGDTQLMNRSRLSLTVKGKQPYGENPQVVDLKHNSMSEIVQPTVPLKYKTLQYQYRELILSFQRSFSVVFRAYNEGVAYRFVLGDTADSLRIVDEEVEYNWAGNYRILYPREQNMMSHYERKYIDTTLSGLDNRSFGSLPTTLQASDGTTIAVSDADVFDYPNLFLSPEGATTLTGRFPRRVLEITPTSDRNQKITRKADDIAVVKGDQKLPWRALKIGENESELLGNTLFYKLARDLKLENTDWINAGKVAWDWWNALNIYGVPFEAGVNMKTYKYYIDFAAEHGLDFVILDEGWSDTQNLLDVTKSLNIPELVSYAEKRDVGVIVWMLWKPLQQHMERYMSQFEKWGISGIKVDFMQRADQDMVQFYEEVAHRAAGRHLLVNFHGSFKPSGLRRAYPNVMTYEGVLGLEHSKWQDADTPTHDVTLPFTRMTAGPMDYTPGAMINAHKDNFRPIYTRPMSQGTRAHQVAMYAIYESGLQMLADSPTHYKEEPKTTEYIARFPVTWHETRVLEAELAEHLLMARRHEQTWYLGGMTGRKARKGQIKLSFLEKGRSYKATVFEDGVNADRYAEDFSIREVTVSKGNTLSYEMGRGGGWSAIIKPVSKNRAK